MRIQVPRVLLLLQCIQAAQVDVIYSQQGFARSMIPHLVLEAVLLFFLLVQMLLLFGGPGPRRMVRFPPCFARLHRLLVILKLARNLSGEIGRQGGHSGLPRLRVEVDLDVFNVLDFRNLGSGRAWCCRVVLSAQGLVMLDQIIIILVVVVSPEPLRRVANRLLGQIHLVRKPHPRGLGARVLGCSLPCVIRGRLVLTGVFVLVPGAVVGCLVRDSVDIVVVLEAG